MSIRNKIAQYHEYKHGVSHCTFNPGEPGVVRIHLIPPRFRLFGSSAYIVILNGYFMLPIGYSWAIILSKFMQEVNKFDGRPISDNDEIRIVERTVNAVRAVYPSVDSGEIREDLSEITRVLFAVARRDDPEIDIEKLSIRRFAENMTAPHRMDLMISSMADSNGRWNCNQKCTFCYAAGQCKSHTDELTTEEWKSAIDKLRRANVPMVTFTGGEPTMREDLADLVGDAKEMVTRLNTNGIKLTSELAERLKFAGLDSVQVTLYSHDSKIHNELVGGEHFAETVQGIKNAVNAGLDISVNTPLCRKNADYTATLEFIRSLGVRFVTVSGLICTGSAAGKYRENDLNESELCDILKGAKEYCDRTEMEIDFTSPGLVSGEYLDELGMNVPMCGAALSNMAIAPDGTVVPCQSWLSDEDGLGNILTDKFSRIWKSPKCVALRKMSEDEALSCPLRSRGERGKA